MKAKYILTIIMLILFNGQQISAEPLEIKGLKVLCDYEKEEISYELSSPCLIRQDVKLKDGPIVLFGNWEIKEKGKQLDKLITFVDSRISKERLMFDFKAYVIPQREQKEKNTEIISPEKMVDILGLEKNLAVEVKIRKPRLGQLIHDYQKNIKTVIIDLKEGVSEDRLYSIKCAVDADPVLIEQNITLPYQWEKDFKVFSKGFHMLYVEVRGGDKARGISKLEIEVI